MIGTVFIGHASNGLTDALSAAMPWVAAGFGLRAVLCLALPRRAVTAER